MLLTPVAAGLLAKSCARPPVLDGWSGTQENISTRSAAETLGGRAWPCQNEMTQEWLMLLVRMNVR